MLSGSENRRKPQTDISSQKVKKHAKWQEEHFSLPHFLEQLHMLETLVLNLLWVTDP